MNKEITETLYHIQKALYWAKRVKNVPGHAKGKRDLMFSSLSMALKKIEQLDEIYGKKHAK